jgi:hypothetical protein
MFGYFYLDFKERYGPGSIVLAENEYLRVVTNIAAADEFLLRMRDEFRRDHAKGGSLRPDILGFCGKPPDIGSVILELLEVSTVGQATATLEEDVQYKLGKFSQIIKGLAPDIDEVFSLSSFSVSASASKWKPRPMWQRVVPLPLRTQGNITYIEWICFQPSFNVSPPDGIDGLLLYEIHSLPKESSAIPQDVLNRLKEQERRRRAANNVPYGQTLTPWAAGTYLAANAADRQAMQTLAGLLGVGLVIVAAVYLAPVVAGAVLDLLIAGGSDVAVTEASATTIAELTSGLPSTLDTCGQVMQFLGKNIGFFGQFAVP